eukprot:2435131-Rhodomonas_salina.1
MHRRSSGSCLRGERRLGKSGLIKPSLGAGTDLSYCVCTALPGPAYPPRVQHTEALGTCPLSPYDSALYFPTPMLFVLTVASSLVLRTPPLFPSLLFSSPFPLLASPFLLSSLFLLLAPTPPPLLSSFFRLLSPTPPPPLSSSLFLSPLSSSLLLLSPSVSSSLLLLSGPPLSRTPPQRPPH